MPIGQAQVVEPRKPRPCLGGWWKKVYSVAGPLRGHSSKTLGPWTLLYTGHPRTRFNYKITTSTPRVQVLQFPTPRVLYFPHTHPHPRSKCALIATRDTSAVTISLGKGSGNLANASVSGNSTQSGGGYCHVFLWALFSSYFSLSSFSFLLR